MMNEYGFYFSDPSRYFALDPRKNKIWAWLLSVAVLIGGWLLVWKFRKSKEFWMGIIVIVFVLGAYWYEPKSGIGGRKVVL